LKRHSLIQHQLTLRILLRNMRFVLANGAFAD